VSFVFGLLLSSFFVRAAPPPPPPPRSRSLFSSPPRRRPLLPTTTINDSPTEITAFSDRYEEFKKINTEVLGVSVDSQFSHLAWIQTDRKEGECGLFPLFSSFGGAPRRRRENGGEKQHKKPTRTY
jgi:hypothetical protein